MTTRFYFAWVDSSETTFEPEHQREDEEAVSFAIEHSEGEFASLSLSVRNPRIGLLAPARKTWAWFAYGDTPLFFGRLIGVPNDIHQEIVTLVFTARPADYADQKAAVAESLKVFPNYDPVWINPEMLNDPDTVLEGHPRLWHIDRITHEVTASHVITGEDGIEEFQANEVPADSVHVTLGSVPVRSVVVDGSVTWTQSHTGALDLGSGTLLTYTGKSLISDWPKAGASLGGGWRVASSRASDDWNVEATETLSVSVSWNNPAKKHATGDTLSTAISSTKAPLRGDSVSLLLTSNSSSAVGESRVESTSLRLPLWQVSHQLSVAYDAGRERKERIRFTLSAAVQPIVTLPGEEEVVTLNPSGTDVGVPLVTGGVPIGDPGRNSYVTTDRGLRSLEYLISLARTRLLMAARAVDVTFECRFQRVVAMSGRKNARLFNPRLPGGEATGKVKKYAITGDGSGKIRGSVTIGCPIGYGGSVIAVDGTPTYAEEGYVAVGYQEYAGQVVVLNGGDVGYTVPLDTAEDDDLQFPLSRSQAVLVDTWHGSTDAQEKAIADAGVVPTIRYSGLVSTQPAFDAAREIPQRVEEALKNAAIWRELQLVDTTGGPFENTFDIEVTDLEIPAGINLEAAA